MDREPKRWEHDSHMGPSTAHMHRCHSLHDLLDAVSIHPQILAQQTQRVVSAWQQLAQSFRELLSMSAQEAHTPWKGQAAFSKRLQRLYLKISRFAHTHPRAIKVAGGVASLAALAFVSYTGLMARKSDMTQPGRYKGIGLVFISLIGLMACIKCCNVIQTTYYNHLSQKKNKP